MSEIENNNENDHVKFKIPITDNNASTIERNDTLSLPPQLSEIPSNLNNLKNTNIHSSPNLITPGSKAKNNDNLLPNNETLKGTNKKKVMLKSSENIEHKLPSSAVESSSDDDEERKTIKSNSESFKNWIMNYSYVVLVASFFSYMLVSILSSCFGVFFESMGNDLGWSKYRVRY